MDAVAAAVARYFTGSPQSIGALYTFFLLSLRIAVVLGMSPVLYAMPVPARIRALLVLGLSAAMAVGLAPTQPVAGEPMAFGPLLAAAFSELALGVTLAAGILVAFGAVAVAGNLLDVQIGFGMAQVFDPTNNRSMPLLVSVFNMAAVLTFFLVNGHHALLRGLAFSVEVFPVGRPWAMEVAIGPVLKQVGGLFGLGFALAAPVAFCLLLVEAALGAVSRNLPQINMFALSIPLKIVVGLAALSWWSAGMGGVMDRAYRSIYDTWTDVFIAARAQAPEPAGTPNGVGR